MKSISIFNNKGGVGKSTVTLLIADFFSSAKVTIGNRQPRVLVVDLDAQNSTTTALHGSARVGDRIDQELTVGSLMEHLLAGEHPSLDDYLIVRTPGDTGVRKIPLGRLWSLVSDGEAAVQIEETHGPRIADALIDRLRPMLEKEFDIVVYDMPANIDRRNHLPMAALAASDFVVLPTEPSRIVVNALGRTFDILRDVQGAARQRGRRPPKVVGILLNKTDKRTKQYRLHAKDLMAIAREHRTVLFASFLPNAPALASASDDSIRFETLRERYDTYYDHVRRVARELAERCGYTVKKKVTKK
jgi:chromosome partitioning protein